MIRIVCFFFFLGGGGGGGGYVRVCMYIYKYKST